MFVSEVDVSLMTRLTPFGTAFYVKSEYQKKENEMVIWFLAKRSAALCLVKGSGILKFTLSFARVLLWL